MSDRLVTLLEEAARDAVFPPTPPLVAEVRRRIDSGPIPVAEIRLPRTRPPLARPVLASLLMVALGLAVTLSLSVTARRAVADLLGVAGIHVTFGEEPPGTPRPLRRIDLGVRLSKDAASDRAGFEVKTPRVPGETPAYYFDPAVGDRGMVSIVYPHDAPTLAGADLLVTQFTATLREEFVKKIGISGSEVRYLRVRGSDAYWIRGEPHFFFYEDGTGEVRETSIRLAGNVLLWEEDGVTYRIEGAGTLAEARRLASSLR